MTQPVGTRPACARRQATGTAWLLITILAACLASLASAQVLNSERIEQTFGSYGIAVLASDPELRLSNLYSTHEGRRVTRTLALVAYPQHIDSAWAEPHERVLQGASIGATFQAAGWSVIKSGHVYFTTGVPESVSAAMAIAESTGLAGHAYRLSLERDGEHSDYATIIELHHPAYLDLKALQSIYGPAASPALALPEQQLLERGLARLASPDSALSQQGSQIADR